MAYFATKADLYEAANIMLTSEPTAFAFGGLIVGLVLLVFFTIPVIARLLLPKPQDTRLPDHLPFYQFLEDGETIICKDGTVFKVLELVGKEISFMGDIERDDLFMKRKRWFDTLSELGVRVRVYVMRQKRDYHLLENFDNPILKKVAQKWNKRFYQSYQNRHIVVISGLRISSKQKKEDTTVIKRLHDAVESTMSMLHDFKPKILNQKNYDDVNKTPLAFFASLISPITKPKPRGIQGDISELVSTDIVEFNSTDENGLIHFQSGDEHRYTAVIGIKNFGDFTDEEFVSALGAVDGEVTIMHVVEPWTKVKATALLAQQGRMNAVTRLSGGAKVQFDQAMEWIEGIDENRQTLATYQMVIYISGETPGEVSNIFSDVRRICVNYGVSPVREGIAAQASWFAQFPSFSMWPRPFKFFSGNIGTLVSFDHAPEGLPTSDWGDGPIAMFKTNMGTPYQFQFHVSEEKDAVAHGIIIGPTGGGKTTLISFLTGMAMRHKNLRSYLFDRYLGAYVFTNAAGGTYINVDSAGNDGQVAGVDCSLNPFQCADTSENRAFLRSWLQGISGCDDAESLEEIGRAVKLNFESGLDMHNRSLKTLYEVCFAPDRPLAKELKRWIDPQIYGNIFNAPKDTLDISANQLIAFDFTRIYSSEDLTRAMLAYLMHRIQATISERQSPALIFVDETEPLLKHPMFRDWFLKMLQEYRKRGAGVLSAFQRPEALAATGVSELIRGQAQTMFFLRNPQAQERDYADFSLNEVEWRFIKGGGAQHLDRAVLIKRASGESVILDTDLSVLGEHLKMYNSGRESVRLAEELQKEFGTNWIMHYLDQG